MLVLLAVLLAVTDGLFGAARTGIATSTALFASAAFVAGGRTLVASAFALATAPEIRPAVTGLRAATMQFGYFVGSIAGGAALAVGGYGALGAHRWALSSSAAAGDRAFGRTPTRRPRPSAARTSTHDRGRGEPALATRVGNGRPRRVAYPHGAIAEVVASALSRWTFASSAR